MPKRILSVCMVSALILVAGGPVESSPLDVLEQQEMAHSDLEGDVYLGRILILMYPSYSIDADEAYFSDLVQLADALKTEDRKHYAIVLKGFTDSSGLQEENLQISKLRAERLKKFLVAHPVLGISADRIIAEGHGAANPIAPNDTAESRKKNRRVEIHVYSTLEAARHVPEQSVGHRADRDAPPPELTLTGTRPIPSRSPESLSGRFLHAAAIQRGCDRRGIGL